MPAIRAMLLALPLLVAGVRADAQHRSVAADDLALLAHRLDRRSDLHDSFRKKRAIRRRAQPNRGPRARLTRLAKVLAPAGIRGYSMICIGPAIPMVSMACTMPGKGGAWGGPSPL